MTELTDRFLRGEGDWHDSETGEPVAISRTDDGGILIEPRLARDVRVEVNAALDRVLA